jgi:hypothetical protein
MKQPCKYLNERYSRSRSRYFGIFVLILLGTANRAYPQRPPMVQPQQMQVQLGNLKTVAPSSVSDADPDMCPSSSGDPNEKSIGGLSSRSVYEFSSQPHLENLYARLILVTQVCTNSTLSSKDQKTFQKVLKFLNITDARSFSASVSQTGNGLGGIKYPDSVPFGYAYDESKSTYSVTTIGKAVIPWQVTDSFEVHYSYAASTKLSIDTPTLFRNVVTAVAGGGGAAALLSPAANGYLSAAQTVLQNLGQVFTQIDNSSDSYHVDMRGGPDRSITWRFRDLSNRPLAAVRLIVSFTNSIASPIPVDPTTDATKHIPQFTQLQDILSVTVGGPPSGAQTLLQQISKEPSYQSLLKSTTDTTPASFASSCDQLESALQTIYGLNIYDTALTMGQVLSQENTLYLNHKKFYTSGCFRNQKVLKDMGITVFEQTPTSD